MELLKVKQQYFGYGRQKHNQVTDRESGINYLIAPANISDARITRIWIAEGYDTDSYRCGHEHDCCACPFWGRMWIQRLGRFAIARQGFGINI